MKKGEGTKRGGEREGGKREIEEKTGPMCLWVHAQCATY